MDEIKHHTVPLQHMSLADLVYNNLYNRIAEGVWNPGDKIPNEFELSAELGVSRVSVRSAIQKLMGLGMLEIRRGDGTYVQSFSLQNYLQQAVPFLIRSEDHSEMAQFREALESQAVKLAIDHYDEAAFDHLEELFQRSNEAFDRQDVEAYATNDMLFHRQLCIDSGNKIILTMWDAFAKPLVGLIKSNVESVMRFPEYVDDNHLLLINAMRERNLDKALHYLHLVIYGILPNEKDG